MKTFEEFNEEYMARIPIRYGQGENRVTIYENPSSTDAKDLKKEGGLVDNQIRFFAVRATKKVYAWNGMQAMHQPVLDKLAEIFSSEFPKMRSTRLGQVVCGTASIQGTSFIYRNSSTFNEDLTDKLRLGHEPGPGYMPSDYPLIDDLRKALPGLVKDYEFIERYIKEWSERGLLAQIEKSLS